MIPGNTPNPSPLTSISPSNAFQLLQCESQVAFSLDKDFQKYNKKTPRTVLGSAFHNFVEAVYKNTDITEGDLDTLWQKQIDKAEDELAESWYPRKPSKPSAWPGFKKKRRYAKRKAKTIIQSRLPAQNNNTQSGNEPDRLSSETKKREYNFPLPARGEPLSEQWLKVPDEHISGKVDLIECYDEGKYSIIDIKTGAFINAEEIEDKHQSQLFLYAYMFFKIKKFWPTKLEIETSESLRYQVNFTAEQVIHHVEDLISSREAFNIKAENRSLDFVATPSRFNCQWCIYKVVCSSFWEAYTKDWYDEKTAMCGRIKISDEGFEILEIHSPRERKGDVIPLPTGAPEGLRKEHHEWLMVTDFESIDGLGNLKPGPITKYAYF